MSTLLMTGFPGFLGSALLPRLLARRPAMRAVCLVQRQHLGLAGQRVAKDTARRVNVDGTANVLRFCTSRRSKPRLHYVSTCYVSGSHEGIFGEDDLDEGQVFRNHYESTKWEAEMAVHLAMADGLQATIYRPGIVVGDSTTGVTQKYDGPYFLAAFLLRQLGVAVVPAVGDPDKVRVSLVPRDFVVDAMDELSVLDASAGRTYALTDPDPPTVRELVDAFADHLGKRVVWVRLPLGVTHGLLATRSDLEGSAVVCPPFAEYAGTLLEFMRAHPEIDSAAMV